MEKAQGSLDSCKSCKHKRANSVGMCELDRGEEQVDCAYAHRKCVRLFAGDTNERYFKMIFFFQDLDRENYYYYLK